MGELDILITSLPHKERLVAEIYYNNVQWVQISQETEGGEFLIEFYAGPQKETLEFTFDEALHALLNAGNQLAAMDCLTITIDPATIKTDDFDIVTASYPYLARPVVEIYYDNICWVQISQEIEGDEYRIKFYPHPTKRWWEFIFVEATLALQKAKNCLAAMSGK